MPISVQALRAFAPGNYAYVTARVRAKKTKLLPKEEYTKLVAMSTSEIARSLEEGEYKKEVLSLAQKHRGALLVEHATRMNLSNTYRDVLGMSKGELRRMILLYLQRYDVYNIKTLLRGRFSNAPEEEISRALVPAGALTAEDLEGYLRLGTLAEVVEALRRTPYGAALETVTGSVARLTEIENALDKRYYKLLLEAVEPTDEAKRAFLAFLRTEVDAVNLRTVLRLRASGLEDAGDLLLEGGQEITEDVSRRLLRAAPGELAAELESTRFAAAIPAIRETLEKGVLNPSMTAIERVMMAASDSFGLRYPLSILPVIDFVLDKKREVDNIRIIASGKETGLPESVIEGLLLL